MNTSHLFAAVTLSASALLIGCNASQNSVFYSPKANPVAVETTSPLVQNHTSIPQLEPLISHAQQSDLAFNIVKSLTTNRSKLIIIEELEEAIKLLLVFIIKIAVITNSPILI